MERKERRDERNSISSNNSGSATLREHNAATKQRRARVSRACDECRARKTKCDGRQPCGNCEAFERYCSYHISQGRLGTAQRSKLLEDRLRRAHAHIRELQQQLPSSSHVDPDALFGFPPEVKDHTNEQEGEGDGSDSDDDLDSMLDGTGRLTNSGKEPSGAYYGGSSGFAFLARTREFFENSDNDAQNSQVSKKSPAPMQSAITKLFDAPFPDKQILDLDVPIAHVLPSHDAASELVRIVFSQAYPLFSFVDEHAFEEQIDRIYKLEPYDYKPDDHVFMPLFYIALGLGMLFSRKAHRELGCGRAVTQGMRYFIASRQMLDVTRCHHIASLQTLVCFALFLISTARLATAHTYVSLAISAALKMGLHCMVSADDPFTPHEAEMRRRVFWTITKLDIYTSSCLGLPPMSSPLEADVTSQKLINNVIGGLRDGSTHKGTGAYYMMCAVRHLELMLITAKMVKQLYQKETESVPGKSRLRRLRVGRAKIHGLEVELQEWRDRTAELIQHQDGLVKTTIIKYDLELSDAFARIILYRPFLHYLGPSKQQNPPNEQQIRCALHCIQASKEVIHKSQVMLEEDYLGPASWHAMYTIFMAIVALIFYLATQSDSHERATVRYEVEIGVRILASTTCQDTGSEKCLDVLRALTERLSRRVNLNIDEIRATAISSAADAHHRQLHNENPKRKIQEEMEEQPTQHHSLQEFKQESNQRMDGVNKSSSQAKVSPYSQHHGPVNQQQQQQQRQATVQYNAEHRSLTASAFPIAGHRYHNMSGMTGMGVSEPEMDAAAAAQYNILDAMQVPFSDSIGWPMGINPGFGGIGGHFGDPTADGVGPVSNSTIPSSHFPVAFEDLDEFFFDET